MFPRRRRRRVALLLRRFTLALTQTWRVQISSSYAREMRAANTFSLNFAEETGLVEEGRGKEGKGRRGGGMREIETHTRRFREGIVHPSTR